MSLVRSNSWADNRNLLENKLPTNRGDSGTVLTVTLDFGTLAGSVGIAVSGITGGSFKRVNVVLADHHDNEVSITGTTTNVANTVRSLSTFSKSDDLRVQVFAVKTTTEGNGEMPLLATSQPDQLIQRGAIEAGSTVTVEFRY